MELTAPLTSGSVPKQNKIHPRNFGYSPDWDKIVSCLSEHAPESSGINEDGKSVETIFSGSACSVCPFLEVCAAKRMKDGRYRVCFQRERIAVAERRLEQEAADFKDRYKIRSGIEAMISEADRVTGLKRV
ncbi:transposase [Thermodesulfobacteriota bacterium]